MADPQKLEHYTRVVGSDDELYMSDHNENSYQFGGLSFGGHGHDSD